MKCMIKILTCASIILYLQLAILTAQELPQGYFGSPLKGDLGLSPTFGESRI